MNRNGRKILNARRKIEKSQKYFWWIFQRDIESKNRWDCQGDKMAKNKKRHIFGSIQIVLCDYSGNENRFPIDDILKMWYDFRCLKRGAGVAQSVEQLIRNQ